MHIGIQETILLNAILTYLCSISLAELLLCKSMQSKLLRLLRIIRKDFPQCSLTVPLEIILIFRAAQIQYSQMRLNIMFLYAHLILAVKYYFHARFNRHDL